MKIIPINPTVNDYIEYLNRCEYPSLFDSECLRRLANVSRVYGDKLSDEICLEILLDDERKSVDYSFLTKPVNEVYKELWYELDYDSIKDENIKPCFFIDGSFIKSVEDLDNNKETLIKFMGENRFNIIYPTLRKCVEFLHENKLDIYQLGAMDGRDNNDRIRLFPRQLSKEKVIELLTLLNYDGDLNKLDEILTNLLEYNPSGKYFVDFDILANGISSKIGINFMPRQSKNGELESFLDYLVNNNLCVRSKIDDICKWLYRSPRFNPYIQNQIDHYKFAYEGNEITKSKLYLGHTHQMTTMNIRGFDHPITMNLELTERCPLHCPQCYCELEKGRDLDLDTALYFVEEAHKNHVLLVNLSGGETMVYPHLTEIIKKCHEYGMNSNIALSGYGVTKEKLLEFIDAGVSGIFVSLNGSTSEINSLTRDGYQLAINALKTLNEIDYDNITINWVMHKNNVDDFPDLVKLAENYNVKEIAVMVFKPNSKHELPTVPSFKQMKTIANFIKEYKGPIHIEPEGCFSQMKALVADGFLMNRNIGPFKGCGAGRDGISISVDGKITPCRHLVLLLTGCASQNNVEDTSSTEDKTDEIANPWKEVETLHEAEHLVGFEVNAFGEFNDIERSYIAVLDSDTKMVEVRYGDDIIVRKAVDNGEDISGDYNEYSWTTESDDAIFPFTAKGNKEGVVNNATWSKDGYAYSITSKNGLSLEDTHELVTEVTALSFKEVKDLDEANSITGFTTTVNRNESYTVSTMEIYITQITFSDGIIVRKASNFPNVEGVARIFEELDVEEYSYGGSTDVDGTTVLMMVSSEDTVNCIQWTTEDSLYLIHSANGFSVEDIPTLMGYVA